MTRVATATHAFEFVSRGKDGRAVLFLPGSYSTAAAWRGVWAHLPESGRLAATSLLGFGATVETRRDGEAGIAHELAVVRAAAARLGGGPVHLVGHSFGGTVALSAVLSGEVPVASLALFEANPLDLIADEVFLYGEACDLAAAFAAELEAGEGDAARHVIDYWGGSGVFAAMPSKVRDFCRRTARTNALDWKTCLGFRPDPSAIAAIDIPVLLVRGERAIPAMVAITERLGALLPAAQRAVVTGAGHFVISTHPADCARLLSDHLVLAAAPAELQTGRP